MVYWSCCSMKGTWKATAILGKATTQGIWHISFSKSRLVLLGCCKMANNFLQCLTWRGPTAPRMISEQWSCTRLPAEVLLRWAESQWSRLLPLEWLNTGCCLQHKSLEGLWGQHSCKLPLLPLAVVIATHKCWLCVGWSILSAKWQLQVS